MTGDEWLRRGLAHGVHDLDGFELVHAWDLEEARERPGELLAADHLVIDPWAAPSCWDRLDGLSLVEGLRSVGFDGRVIALLPVDPHGVFRLRASEIGITRTAERGAMRSLEDLERLLVTGPDPALAPEIVRRLSCLGLSGRSRPHAGLAHVVRNDLTAAFSSERPPLSRRQQITIRSKLADIIGIEPMQTGSGAVVERVLPSWRHLRDIINIARGAFVQ